MTTLQREILRFVLIIASLATSLAILIVILWAAWWALVPLADVSARCDAEVFLFLRAG